MKRKIILVATSDPEFEVAAMHAILLTRHGMRRTRDAHEVWRSLTSDNGSIDLAVIDVDFHDCGLSLLHILNNSAPGCPVLAVTGDPALFARLKNSDDGRAHSLCKPVSVAVLHEKIVELCTENETAQATAALAQAQ